MFYNNTTPLDSSCVPLVNLPHSGNHPGEKNPLTQVPTFTSHRGEPIFYIPHPHPSSANQIAPINDGCAPFLLSFPIPWPSPSNGGAFFLFLFFLSHPSKKPCASSHGLVIAGHFVSPLLFVIILTHLRFFRCVRVSQKKERTPPPSPSSLPPRARIEPPLNEPN